MENFDYTLTAPHRCECAGGHEVASEEEYLELARHPEYLLDNDVYIHNKDCRGVAFDEAHGNIRIVRVLQETEHMVLQELEFLR